MDEAESSGRKKRARLAALEGELALLRAKYRDAGYSLGECIVIKKPDLPPDYDPVDISAPSSLNRDWFKYQFHSRGKKRKDGSLIYCPRWMCYRGPPEAQPTVPVALIHPSFEDFCAAVRGPPLREIDWKVGNETFEEFYGRVFNDRAGLDDADIKLASDIWDKFTLGFQDHEEEMTDFLNGAFRKYLSKLISRVAFCGAQTDGYTGLENAEGTSLVEDKRSQGDALFQALEHVRQMFRDNAQLGTRISHCIVVLRSYPYIQFVAMVMQWASKEEEDFEGKVLAEPLTDFISCWGPKDLGLAKLARALKALKLFLAEYHPESFIDTTKPFCLSNWCEVTSLAPRVFLGRNSDGNKRVAKFTSKYCSDAHTAWASKGIAPALYEVKRLASGWIMVVMEYVDPQDDWVCAAKVQKDYRHNLEALKTALKKALVEGHGTGYVHGDFRLPNVFVKMVEKKDVVSFLVKVVDFDWAGPIGKAVYPEVVNPDLKYHEDAEVGEPIKEAHDFVFVDRL